MSTRRTRSTLLSPPPGAFRSPSVQPADNGEDDYMQDDEQDSLFVTPARPKRRSTRIANTGSSSTKYNDAPTSALSRLPNSTPSRSTTTTSKNNRSRPTRKPQPQLSLHPAPNPPPGLSEAHLTHILHHKPAYDALLRGINHRVLLRKYLETRARIWKTAMEKTQARLEELEVERVQLEEKMREMMSARVEFEGVYGKLAGDEREDLRVKGVWDRFMSGEEVGEVDGLVGTGEVLRAPSMSSITGRDEIDEELVEGLGLGLRAPSWSPITDHGREGSSERSFGAGDRVYEEPFLSGGRERLVDVDGSFDGYDGSHEYSMDDGADEDGTQDADQDNIGQLGDCDSESSAFV